jgi:exopolysaccharide biosynthesis polyprenyl glycosylphosphotransferase
MLSFASSKKIWKTALLPVIDFLALMLGSGIVYLVRYRWFEGSFIGNKEVTSSQYLLVVGIMIVFVILIYAFFGLYEVNRKLNIFQTSLRLAFGIIFVLLALITFLFFNEYNTETLPQGVPISRFILATGGFFAFYFVALGRLMLWAFEQILYKLKIGLTEVALINDDHGLMTNYLLNRSDISKIYSYSKLDQESLNVLSVALENGNLSEIFVFGPQNEYEKNLIELAERYKASLFYSPTTLIGDYVSLRPITINQQMFLESSYASLDGWWVIVKRLFDIFVSLFGLIILSPVYIIVSILIVLESRGPVFYLSERVGPNGKVFKLWKFRRFKVEYNTSETTNNLSAKKALEFEQKLIETQNLKPGDVLYKIKDDPRRTKIGIFIEKYSIDELPQLINVLIGNMSLVGPRPHQPREVAKYSKHHFKVLNIKPGITGLAQINGRSDLSFEEEVRLDTYYVENWSFLLDFWIIIRTPFAIFFSTHKS